MAIRTRVVSGQVARLLPEPGDAILRNPEILEEVPEDSTEGLTPPASIDATPTASGETPRQERERAISAAEAIIQSSLDVYSDEETELRSGPAPHFFLERSHQAYYHEAIVYIEGEDVSQFLTGSISWSYGFGTDHNKCDFTLDNAGHRFTLTPENLQGIFRRATPSLAGFSFDYDETVKANMYARKSRQDYNPVDPDSGGRRFPLHLWGCIFHKHDAVRVWVRNPVSELDEWIPVFTGYIISKPTNEDYINGLNNLSVSCADIRYLMANMRVNTNTLFAVLPGSQTTGAADPTNESPISGIEVFRSFAEQGNQQFNSSFFAQLIANSYFQSNPWASLNLPELIAALTFFPGDVSRIIDQADARARGQIGASRDAGRQEAQDAAAEIEPLHLRVQEGGEGALSDSERGRYRQLLTILRGYGVAPGTGAPEITDTSMVEEDEAENPSAPTPPPGASPGSTLDVTRSTRRVSSERGGGRIGRMRPGVFPFFGNIVGDPSRPWAPETYFPSASPSQSRAVTNRQVQQRMLGWHSLCVFGTPVRHDFTGSTGALLPEDAAPDYSIGNRRYWTEEEVRRAGRSTRREGAWSPEAQGVHFLSPGRSTPNDFLWQTDVLGRGNVSANLNWSNRLQLISDACETADYRFWVSGSGDLIFEFAQYDFSPEDYGTWSEVLSFDHHLLNESFDEEGGAIVTAVLVNGSFVGIGNIDESRITPLNPARSVGIWSPNLASRLGVQIKTFTYPQVTDITRLEQLAALEFQKLLASADKYSLSAAFRPWVSLNRPIYNKYRERIALVDGISFTYPVTAGQYAGNSPPSMSLNLNYTRSFDELGLPRYITGGPANPMYFAIPADPRRSLVSTLQERVRDFESAMNIISREEVLSEEDFLYLRDRYRAIIPNGQATYNVIGAAFPNPPDRPAGEESEVATSLRAIDALLDETVAHSGSFTPEERMARLEELRSRVEEIESSLRAEGVSSSAEQSPAGARPRVGISGVRSTLQPSIEVVEDNTEDDTSLPSCSPGDPRFYSSPCGPAPRIVPKWRAFRESLPSRDRRSILDQYARGQLPDSSIDRGVGIWQYANEFPRIVTSDFGLRNSSWHPGIDIPMDFGEPCYAVADGVVFYIRQSTGQGMGLGLLHSGGFVTFYRHQDHLADGISLGATVKRNQVVSYTGFSGTERGETITHLHFETGAVVGSEPFNRYVGEGKRFRIVRPEDRNTLDTLPAAERGRVLGSIRVVYGVGGGSEAQVLNRWDPGLIEQFDLDFLRRRDGSFGLSSRLILFYSPSPISDPFSQAETIGRPTPVTDMLSLAAYYEQFGLKGVPSLRMAADPERIQLRQVPEIPNDATGARRARLEQERASAARFNQGQQRRRAAYSTSRNQQKALFFGEVPPNTCPPEAYEGTQSASTSRTLPNRQRLTSETAEAARRSSQANPPSSGSASTRRRE